MGQWREVEVDWEEVRDGALWRVEL
jgi:hypothetical protein